MNPSIPARALLQRENLDNPYPFYRRLQREAPVWRVPDTEIFVVTRYALVDEATRRIEDFSSHLTGVVYRRLNGAPTRLIRGQGLVQALATADPPAHTLHKKAVFPELVARRMAAMAPEVEELASACIEPLLAGGGGDFMAAVGNPVPIRVISRLGGFRDMPEERLLQAAFDSTAVVSGSQTLPQLVLCLLRSFLTHRWVTTQLRDSSPAGDDIMAAVQRSIRDGVLSEAEGRAIMHTLLAAGGESTSSLLGNAVRILAEDQPLQSLLREEPAQLPAFLEEVLRLESPFRYHLRTASRDTGLGGVAIPAGATLLLFWAAANRDPEAFANPDSIDLERPRTHVAFGRGIHACVGAPLARLEGRIVLEQLLARTSRIEPDLRRAPRWVRSLQVRRHARLPVRLHPA